MNILVYPDEILSKSANDVTNIDQQLISVIDEMFKTMYEAKGIGLAGNQVGLLKKLVVMDVAQKQGASDPIVLINPRIVESEGIVAADEGCLSVPEFYAEVKRAERILVEAFDQTGKPLRFEADGLLARCIQHEIDHLMGHCFVDRLSPLKRSLFKKKWAKMQKKEG